MKRWFSEAAKVVSIRSVLRSVSMMMFFAVVLPVYVGMTSDQFWPAWAETFVAVLVMGRAAYCWVSKSRNIERPGRNEALCDRPVPGVVGGGGRAPGRGQARRNSPRSPRPGTRRCAGLADGPTTFGGTVDAVRRPPRIQRLPTSPCRTRSQPLPLRRRRPHEQR